MSKNDDKPARKIMKGKVGDQFFVAEPYEGKKCNAVGVPLGTPRGPAVPIPAGNGPANLTIYTREDFRKVDKNEPINGKKEEKKEGKSQK